ncbi:MAG: glycosyltransferase family 117 protein [Brevinema sp.]
MSQNHLIFDKLYPNSYHPYLLKKIDFFLAGFVFLLSLGVYFKTLNPSVTAGDSGELITTVYNMGASHPPGFPLYGIIGKLFTFLRFSDIGYKMNIFSGVSAAITVLFTYLSMVKLLGFNKNVQSFDIRVHFPALAASLLFAFSKAHWSQAVMAEVYALNAALSSVLFFLMIIWYEEIMSYRNEEDNLWLAPRTTLLLAFFMGLSITNHQIPIWYIIAWGILLIPIMIILVSFKGKDFIQQFQERKFPMIVLGIVCIMAVFILVISAIKPHMLFPQILQGEYRLIFPQHVPYILTAIFCIPIWLSFYICQNYLYKLQRFSTMSRNTFDITHALFFLCVVGIIVFSFIFLGGINGILVCVPLVMTTIYQFSQRQDLHKRYKNNWVDYFFFILTIAMWLLIFAVSIYLYMWIRAKAIAPLVEPKPLSWGDTQSLDILFNHMLRKQYPVGSDDYSNILGQIWALWQYHINQFGIINVILGFVGAIYFLRRDPVQAGYFILASFIYLWTIVEFINFEVDPRSMETQEVFFIQQFLVFSFFIAFAYQLLLELLQKIKSQNS